LLSGRSHNTDELVGFGDFALALRAGGMQVAFAAGAELNVRLPFSALRARIRQRLTHQEINDEPDGHKRQDRISTSKVHKPDIMAAALRVAIHVGNQKI